jgi:hypothetical protein
MSARPAAISSPISGTAASAGLRRARPWPTRGVSSFVCSRASACVVVSSISSTKTSTRQRLMVVIAVTSFRRASDLRPTGRDHRQAPVSAPLREGTPEVAMAPGATALTWMP